jgi:hypothetical protein
MTEAFVPKTEDYYSIHERRADGVDVFHRTFRGALKTTGISRSKLDRLLRTGKTYWGSTFKKIPRIEKPPVESERIAVTLRINRKINNAARKQLGDTFAPTVAGILEDALRKTLNLKNI